MKTMTTLTKPKMVTMTTATGETKRVRLYPGYAIKNGKRHYLLPRISAKAKALRQKQWKEQERNNAIFAAEHLPALLKTHSGQVAVMKRGKISGFYPSFDEAIAAAERRYPTRIYSVHKVEERKVIRLSGIYGVYSSVVR